MKLRAAAILALVLLLAACAGVPGTPLTGHVQGHVTVTPCRPVETFPPSPCPPAAGVRVSFGTSVSTTTDANGDYAVDLLPGDYEVTVAAGMVRRPVRIRVNAGDHLTLDLNVDSGIR